jgi:hypothetical protein
VNTTRYCKYSRAPDDGRKHRPKHVELNWNNKLIYIGSNLGEHYKILQIQSSALDDGRKHRPKHVEPNLNNKLIYIVHLLATFIVISVYFLPTTVRLYL